MIFNLAQFKKHAETLKNVETSWEVAMPMNYDLKYGNIFIIIKHRIKAAILVLSGRACAIRWYK